MLVGEGQILSILCIPMRNLTCCSYFIKDSNASLLLTRIAYDTLFVKYLLQITLKIITYGPFAKTILL